MSYLHWNFRPSYMLPLSLYINISLITHLKYEDIFYIMIHIVVLIASLLSLTKANMQLFPVKTYKIQEHEVLESRHEYFLIP